MNLSISYQICYINPMIKNMGTARERDSKSFQNGFSSKILGSLPFDCFVSSNLASTVFQSRQQEKMKLGVFAFPISNRLKFNL